MYVFIPFGFYMLLKCMFSYLVWCVFICLVNVCFCTFWTRCVCATVSRHFISQCFFRAGSWPDTAVLLAYGGKYQGACEMQHRANRPDFDIGVGIAGFVYRHSQRAKPYGLLRFYRRGLYLDICNGG